MSFDAQKQPARCLGCGLILLPGCEDRHVCAPYQPDPADPPRRAIYVADAGGRCRCGRVECAGCVGRAVADPIGPAPEPVLAILDLIEGIADDLRSLLAAGPRVAAVINAAARIGEATVRIADLVEEMTAR